MTGSATDVFTTLPLADAERLDQVCDAFEAAWRDEGEPPRLDDFLTPLAARMQSAALLELLPIELAYLKQRGTRISASDYRRRYPTAAPYLEQWLADRPQSDTRLLAAGDRFGKYTIEEWIDAGGMGDVYRAVDTTLGREVAIKILLHRYRWSPEALARISTEARALAALNDPHIVTVHELAEHEGVAYIAMEMLQGQTLAKRLREGALPPEEALRIAATLARALSAAHKKGIIHRDLKPQNIYLTAAGPKVLDFGLARLAEMQFEPAGPEAASPAASGNGTATGSRVGTTGYMSPEQVRGQSVDARTDIFSFGCVLYEMLFYGPPFRRGSLEETDDATLNATLPRPVSSTDRLAESLYGVCERCLRKSPAERYASALLLTQELAEIETNHAQRPGRTLRRMERALLTAAFLLLAGLGIWWWHRSAELARLQGQLDSLLRETQTLSLDKFDRMKVVVRELNRIGPLLGWSATQLDTTIRGTFETKERLCVVGHLNLERGTKDEIETARVDFFQKVLDQDDHFAPAHIGLGESYYALSNAYANPTDMMPLVERHARSAIECGDESGAALVLLGICEHRFHWNWTKAEEHFRGALKLNAHSATALHMYGNALVLQERFEDGVPMLEAARDQDPDSLQIRTDLGLAYLYCGDLPKAQKEIDGVLRKEPFFPAQWALGEIFLHRKAWPDAVGELRKACDLDKDNAEAKAELAFCLGMNGQAEEAGKVIQELQEMCTKQYVPPTARAVALLGLGKEDEAMQELWKGLHARDEWLVWLNVDPVFKELKKEHFDEIEERISASQLPASPSP